MYTFPMPYTINLMAPKYHPNTDAIIGEKVVHTLPYHPETLSGAKFLAQMLEHHLKVNGDDQEFRVVVTDSKGNAVAWWGYAPEENVFAVFGLEGEFVNDPDMPF